MSASETAKAAKSSGKQRTPEGSVKVFKTAVFKIHNPSKRKRSILRTAMKYAHVAYGKLLINRELGALARSVVAN